MSRASTDMTDHSPDHAERIMNAILTADTSSPTWRGDLHDTIIALLGRNDARAALHDDTVRGEGENG